MIASRKTYNENKYVKLGTYNFETVNDYTYPGKCITNINPYISFIVGMAE
jgi:hypothetical protein